MLFIILEWDMSIKNLVFSNVFEKKDDFWYLSADSTDTPGEFIEDDAWGECSLKNFKCAAHHHLNFFRNIQYKAMCHYNFGTYDLHAKGGYHRWSINFFAFEAPDLSPPIDQDDEAFLSHSRPEHLKWHSCAVGSAIAVHFSYSLNHEALFKAGFYEPYRKLSFEMERAGYNDPVLHWSEEEYVSKNKIVKAIGLDFGFGVTPAPPVHCGNLTIDHGAISLSNEDLIGSTATVTCNQNYLLINTTFHVATCLSVSRFDGKWFYVPTCNAIKCGAFSVENGVSTLSNSDLIGSQATVICQSGYLLSSKTLSSCSLSPSGTTGTWIDVPSCKGIG